MSKTTASMVGCGRAFTVSVVPVGNGTTETFPQEQTRGRVGQSTGSWLSSNVLVFS